MFTTLTLLQANKYLGSSAPTISITPALFYKFNSGDINGSNKIFNYQTGTYDLQMYNPGFFSINTGVKKAGSGALILNGNIAGSIYGISTTSFNITSASNTDGIAFSSWFRCQGGNNLNGIMFHNITSSNFSLTIQNTTTNNMNIVMKVNGSQVGSYTTSTVCFDNTYHLFIISIVGKMWTIWIDTTKETYTSASSNVWNGNNTSNTVQLFQNASIGTGSFITPGALFDNTYLFNAAINDSDASILYNYPVA